MQNPYLAATKFVVTRGNAHQKEGEVTGRQEMRWFAKIRKRSKSVISPTHYTVIINAPIFSEIVTIGLVACACISVTPCLGLQEFCRFGCPR